MVSTWSSGSALPTTNFRSMLDDDKTQEGLTFVDFFPDVHRPAGFFTKAKYGTFSSLVDRANDWLRANPQWEIKTCESVEFKDKGNTINSQKMIYTEYREASTWYIRGLRLWITSRKSAYEKVQQIGYMNIVPRKAKEGGMFSSPVFETLDSVINSFNAMIQTQPIPGRIITIESQEMMMKSDNEIYPDVSSWTERTAMTDRFLFIIRIFFEISEPHSELIGIKDFIPDRLGSGGIFSLPKYELFSNVVSKASEWCSRQVDVRVCNAQSLEIKLKRGKVVDTQRMLFSEQDTTVYVRILRVAYTRLPPQLKKASFSPSITQLTCKTFVPIQLTNSMFIPEFETLQATKLRISAWMKATGAKVISVQTSSMRLFGEAEKKYGSEASVFYDSTEENQTWVFVIRVYMNGFYPEPPEGSLPPMPEKRHTNCSIL